MRPCLAFAPVGVAKPRSVLRSVGLLAPICVTLMGHPAAAAQTKKNPDAITKAQQMMAGSMLTTVRDSLKRSYYDPALHGINLNARYEKYKAELERAPTLGAAYRVIAALLSGLDDSHTFFIPPPRSWDFHYGYRMQLEGDRAYVTAVRPGSDAASRSTSATKSSPWTAIRSTARTCGR